MTKVLINSSLLEPKPPPESLIPNKRGEVTLCPINILEVHSSDKNWYCSGASDKGNVSIVAAWSLLSLKNEMFSFFYSEKT